MIHMDWQKWVLVAWYLADIFLVIHLIDRPKKPTTSGQAATSVLIFMVLAALVVTA